jgi:threonine dehydrogenase-like Zn-dependent dehydrogenase
MIYSEPVPASTPACVLKGPRELAIEEVPMWPVESYGDPDLVLVKVGAVGVCGSDFRYYLGENPWAQHTLGRFVPNPPNIVLGHEYAGTVVAVQRPQDEHLLGKRVAPVCSKVCGACDDCRNGRTRLCPNTVHMGHGQGWGSQPYYPGAYARYALAWASSCFEISDGLSFEAASMMDILAVCVHVAEVGQVQFGRPILTIGAGPAGNGIAQIANAMGASGSVLLERSSRAIEVAQTQGIGIAIDSTGRTNAELAEELGRHAPSGFGTVFDTVCTPETIDLSLTVLGRAGTLVVLAAHDVAVPINLLRLGAERRLVTSCNFEVGDYPKALALLEAGRVKVSEWQQRIDLRGLPEAFERVTSDDQKAGVFKMVVDPCHD